MTEILIIALFSSTEDMEWAERFAAGIVVALVERSVLQDLADSLL